MSKNTRNRILLTAVAALLLVAVTVGGTMAYLTATAGNVVNTFEPSTIAIDINEHDENDAVTKANTYKMIPGAVLAKDPYVTVKNNSEASYVFVEIIKSATYDDYMLEYTVDTTRWTLVAENDTTRVYMTEQTATTADTDIAILAPETVTVDPDVTKQMMDNMIAGTVAKPTLTFKAYAIQSANLKDDAGDEITDYEVIFTMAGGTLPN